MGLLDILNTIGAAGGAASDPRARPAPAGQATSQATSQGMSPMAKALLGLLAIYAMKNMRRADAPQAQPAPRPGGNVAAGVPGSGGDGGLGDLLRGPLGGILGGAAAGTVLNGGLGGLLKQLQQNGQGDVAHSWIGPGANKTISHDDLASALGSDTLNQLAGQSGMDRDDLLAGLSRYLPGFVDQLTPDGRLPTEEEAERMV
jgi:uncharacterized protein YidB (DUF937 family)